MKIPIFLEYILISGCAITSDLMKMQPSSLDENGRLDEGSKILRLDSNFKTDFVDSGTEK
jgi:hypothetical protein